MSSSFESSLDARIRFAIANRRLMQFTYKAGERERVAEPHDYGVRNGVTKLLVYQLRGFTSSRDRLPAWKELDVSKIAALTVLPDAFPGSRGTAHRQHKNWDIVYARVA